MKKYIHCGCQLNFFEKVLAPAGRPHLMQYGGSTASCAVMSNLPEAQAPCVVNVLSTLMESPAQLYGFGGFTVEKKKMGFRES